MQLPAQMRAIGYQNSLLIDHEQSLQDFLCPKPAPGSTELLVKINAIGVNHIDAKARMANNPMGAQWNILGWDSVGVVEAIGCDVSKFKPGDKIWYSGAINRPGCNSEWHCVEAVLASHAPQSLSEAEAAAFPMTALTAWELLFDRLRIPQGNEAGKGETLLVIGASGGVGSFIVQLAAQLTGMTIIGTASKPDGKQAAIASGAHHVINHREALLPQLEALGFSSVDRVVSTAGSDKLFQQLVECLTPQGAFALIDDPAPGAIDVLALRAKSLSFHWELVFTRSLFATSDRSQQGKILEIVADMVDQGLIKVPALTNLGEISAINLRQAHQLLESGHSNGKLVLAGFN